MRSLKNRTSGWKAVAFALGLSLWGMVGCRQDASQILSGFEAHPAESTGVTFENRLRETDTFNIIRYLYAYNGGGVAVADVNRDGWADLYFTSNQESNRLYLNRGNWKFEDVTREAGLDIGGDWTTGVSVTDINADGWPDLFVCEVADEGLGLKGRTRLFINGGIQGGTAPVFRERAEQYGLALEGFAQQAVWLDYDRDGDLDMFLLQHTLHDPSNYEPRAKALAKQDIRAADRLFRNDGETFTEVSEAAGLMAGRLGYGLDVSVSDINLDGWPDLFVSVDFHENDYLYLNQQDGTFRECASEVFSSMSQFSMGNAVADLNGDGLPEIATLDMRPPTDSIRKKSEGANAFDIFQYKLTFGYAPQFPRNHLHLHAGVGADGLPRFQEACCFAGMEATDWSWSLLPADLNLDGQPELIVTNGIPRRLNDLDYLRFLSNASIQARATDLELMAQMPPGEARNRVFSPTNTLRYTDSAAAWGLDDYGASHGAAVADLDHDGDLDLVVNHLNRAAGLYENKLKAGQSLALDFRGDTLNPAGIGAKVTVWSKGHMMSQENYPVRGWLSCGLPELWFGLGDQARADSLEVQWPDGKRQRLSGEGLSGRITLAYPQAALAGAPPTQLPTLGMMVAPPSGLDFVHREDQPQDITREPLMPHVLSTQGPALAAAKFPWHRRGTSVFTGGAKGQKGVLWVPRNYPEGYLRVPDFAFPIEARFEDVDAVFFDADGDSLLDLYIASGGNLAEPALLQDRLFLNNGVLCSFSGRNMAPCFEKKPDHLPPMPVNTACVRPGDFDQDGDLDLFVGGRSVAGSYGLAPRSYLLENDGKGHFTDVTREKAPGLLQPGMVTDARWADLDQDGQVELILVGEWMPILAFSWTGAAMEPVELGLEKTGGWWNCLWVGDIDRDGDMDLIAGNRGENGVLRATEDAPVWLHARDLDQNGQVDPIISYLAEGRRKPFAGRDMLGKQLVKVKKRYPNYRRFAGASLAEVFPELGSPDAVVHTFSNSWFENVSGTSGLAFRMHALPAPAQFAPIMAIQVTPEGYVLCGGGLEGVSPAYGRYLSGGGMVLVWKDARWEAVSPQISGFWMPGELRNIVPLNTGKGTSGWLGAFSNGRSMMYTLQPQPLP